MNKPHIKNRSKHLVLFLITCLVTVLAGTFLSVLLGFFSSSAGKYIFTGIIALALVLGLLLLINLAHFFKSIDTINIQAEQLARGELNINDILPENAHGLETLARVLNDMKSNLLTFIELTKTNVIIISDAIDNVSKSMNNSYTGNEQIAASIANVAERTQDQSSLMGDTMLKIDEVGNRIDNITTNIEGVEKSVEKTVFATTAGVQHLDDYYEQANSISTSLNTTSDYIKKLTENISEINQISAFIIRISEQLKLLGLNASVEAAKAGESGKGFAVVAHEMNQLSSATKESIVQINTILKNIYENGASVNKSIDKCVSNYDSSKKTFESIKESFQIINTSAGALDDDIKKVFQEISLINTSTKQINEKSILLCQSSEEISSRTQEVAAVTEEELSELEEVNTYTASLQKMLAGIEHLVKRFHTSVTPVAADSPKPLRITFIAPLDHEFWYGVRRGVLYAKNVLAEKNVAIEYLGFKEDVGNQIKLAAINAVETGVDGVIAPGFDPALASIIDNAALKNIPFMLYNCDLHEKNKRVAYFGPNTDSSGTLAARLMTRALNARGNIVIITGGLNAAIHLNRRDTIIAELKKSKRIKVIEQFHCADDPDETYKVTLNLLKQHNNIHGIFNTGGSMTASAKAIEDAGCTGKTVLVCFDHNKIVYEYIQKGIIAAAIGQDPFGQGHDPIVHMFNMLVTHQPPDAEIIWTHLDVVDYANVDDLI